MSTAEGPAFTEISWNELEPHDAAARIISQAVRLQASDLFLLSDEEGLNVALRTMGQVEPIATVSREQGRRLINFLKAEAGIDIGERRRPQEGRWIVASDGHRVDLRLNLVPTLFGEDLAVRLLDRQFGLRPLDALGLLPSDLKRLTALLASPGGLILVTGPSGTGKTTTMYACVQHLNSGARMINTIEDPVEYALAGVRQSQVNAKLGVDFADLLRHIVRHAPDVIMIGEIRDEETAETSIRAANSGHLVLATLHAPVAAGAIQSMRALGAKPYFLSSCLLGIVAQRLVRVLCPECRTAYDTSEAPQMFAKVRPLLDPGQGNAIYGTAGCDACRQQGYVGRTGIFEVMTFSPPLRQMILNERPTEELEQEAIRHGMIEFHRAALLKIAQGVTTTEEVLRELPAEYLGLEL